jgi:soluble lytic murein transglycosylase
MNLALVGIPLALLGAILLFAKPAHALENAKEPAEARPVIVETLARKWGKVFQIPVSWIRSQAWAESKNVPAARNPRTGATGILQILPDTAEWLVTSLLRSPFYKNKDVSRTLALGWTGNVVADLCDPNLNIMLAAYYLNILRKKFGDDHDIVAAAYNAGPTKIATLLDKGEQLPDSSRTYIAMVNDAKRRGFM